MKNINFIKTITAGLMLAAASCPQVLAYSWATKTCEDSSAFSCYKCNNSNTCTATLYQDGRLVVSGNSDIIGCSDCGNSTFENSTVKPTSLIIEEGIETVGFNAFAHISTITKVELPSSVTTVEGDGLKFRSSYQLIINENSSLTAFDRGHGSANYVSSVFCKGDVGTCRSKLEAANSNFANKTITNEIRDADGNLLEKCFSTGCITYDSNERKTAKYSFDDKLMEKYDTLGNVIEEYAYDSNGNLLSKKTYGTGGTYAIYNATGKLVGAKKASPFTPAEAAALVKKGNHNTVTLTFK